jgi:hypothetical protein
MELDSFETIAMLMIHTAIAPIATARGSFGVIGFLF